MFNVPLGLYIPASGSGDGSVPLLSIHVRRMVRDTVGGEGLGVRTKACARRRRRGEEAQDK